MVQFSERHPHSFDARTAALRGALQRGDYPAEVHQDIHFFAYWLSNEETERLVRLLIAVRVAEWGNVIGYLTEGGVQHGQARMEESHRL